MKQGKSIIRKKSNTNVSKIIFPFSQFLPVNQHDEYHSVIQQKKKTYCSDLSKISQDKKQQCKEKSLKSLREKSLTRQIKGGSLSRLISGISKKNTVYERDLLGQEDIKQNNNFLLVEINNFKKYNHRSLTKQRSFTNIQHPFKTQQNQQQNTQLKRLKKQRSLTKLQSEWAQGRAVQKHKQSQHLHKFDSQKIDRTYDHLGKLKKSTLNKSLMNNKFFSSKTISKQINQIDKQVFQQAQKQFNRKYKRQQYLHAQQSLIDTQIMQQNNETKRNLSPKIVNYIRKSPNHGKKQIAQTRTKKEMNVRASADEQLFKTRQDNVNFQHQAREESFYSEMNQKQLPVHDERVVKQNNVRKMEDLSDSENNFFDKQRISQNQQSIIYDKVYFFSSRLSLGFASLFSIERINLKSKANENFIIEVVIKAYQQIVVQRIVYGQHKRNDTFKKQKVLNQKEQQKYKLKNELFSQLIVKKQIAKNREYLPQSIQISSQKQNMLNNSQLAGWYNLNVQSIEGIRNSNQKSEDKSKQSPSSMNFSRVSPQSYQEIIEYIEKYCQLQVSYLGAFLKQSNTAVPIFNQLMKKKHSQLQQTLLQSLNLAKILYFLIKINTTYYIAKTVILCNRKIKYYVLYEFSNMIRHQKQCIIEEEQDVNEGMGKMRKNELVGYLYHQVNRFFAKTVTNNWVRGGKQGKSNQLCDQKESCAQKKDVSLLNALQLCFGSIRQIGLGCDIDSQSQRLYKIIQSNYRNDVRWQKQQLVYGTHPNYDNFFQFHNAFDYELIPVNNKGQSNGQKTPSTNGKVLFASSLIESIDLKEKLFYCSQFSYTITRTFQIFITLYPSAVKSKHQLVRLHPTRLRQHKIQDQFTKQQFLLLHMIQDHRTPYILNSFLKKHYIASIAKQVRQQSTSSPFFTYIKNRKYYVEVYVPFLQQSNPWKNRKNDLMKKMIYILLESRTSVKRYSLKMTLEDVFLEIKEYYRMFTDVRSYKKFVYSINKAKTQMYNMPKEFFSQKLKFYVSKLYLMKKNTYSQFYFIPIPNLISEASHKASMTDYPKSTYQIQPSQSHISNSFRVSENHKALVLQALKKLQASIRQQQKSSKSTISKIKIKNFPTFEIYYKTTRRLIPGYFIIISIYYIPIFDLSEIKFYLTNVQKSFYVSIKKNIDAAQYENIVMVLVEFLRDKFFGHIIAKESEKLSSKYKDFYSRMMRQAESSFISKTRKNKDVLGQSLLHSSNRRNRTAKRSYAMNEVDFIQLTEQLLCKVFQSKRHNKYLVRLSYPSTQLYVSQDQRKGIDEMINISIVKQNCMLIYKFQTTARKLLSKKVTHKFNVIQLQYQEKNKPFYILFQEIKILIQESDQSTYGLLNTFRSYFMNKHYNTVTKENFISMFSINLLAGLSNKLVANDSKLLTQNRINHGANPYHFETQKDINIKDLNNNLYQRYCLFISGSQMLEVLKIRKRNRRNKISSDRSTSSGKLPSFISRDMKSNPFQRRKNRKQSIEANLPSRNILSVGNNSIPNIKMTPPNNNKIPKPKIDYYIQDSYNYSPQQNTQDMHEPHLDEKLVYLINTQTEHVTEIMSSMEDRGFAINVPFGSYNKKMFRRLFRNVVDKDEVYEEEEIKDESFGESSKQYKSQNFSLFY